MGKLANAADAQHIDGGLVFGKRVIKRDLVVGQTEFLAAPDRGAHFLGEIDEFLDDLNAVDRPIVVTGNRLLQPFGETPCLYDILLLARFDLSVEQPAQRFDRQIALLHSADFFEELVREDSNVRLLESRPLKDIKEAVGDHRARQKLRQLQFDVVRVAATISCVLHEVGADGQHEGNVLTQAFGLGSARGERERAREFDGEIEVAFAAVGLCQNSLDGLLQDVEALARGGAKEIPPADWRQEIGNGLVLGEEEPYGSLLVDCSSLPVGLAVRCKGLLKLRAEPQIVNDKTARKRRAEIGPLSKLSLSFRA